jgi:hypothetical protein
MSTSVEAQKQEEELRALEKRFKAWQREAVAFKIKLKNMEDKLRTKEILESLVDKD